MSDKVVKKRVSITFPMPYLDALDGLVEEGIYMSRSEAVHESLRNLFGKRGIEPFFKEAGLEAEDPPEQG